MIYKLHGGGCLSYEYYIVDDLMGKQYKATDSVKRIVAVTEVSETDAAYVLMKNLKADRVGRFHLHTDDEIIWDWIENGFCSHFI